MGKFLDNNYLDNKVFLDLEFSWCLDQTVLQIPSQSLIKSVLPDFFYKMGENKSLSSFIKRKCQTYVDIAQPIAKKVW